MSAKDKVVLDGDCQTNIYTKDTIPENKNEYIIETPVPDPLAETSVQQECEEVKVALQDGITHG